MQKGLIPALQNKGFNWRFLLAMTFCFMFWFMVFSCGTAHASVPRKQSDTLSSYIENPNAYYVGDIVGGDVVANGAAISLRLHPKGTFLLFDENFLFCGNREVVPMLLDKDEQLKKGYLVFTYKKHASRLVEGVPCHQLVSVDGLEKKSDLPQVP